MLFSIEQLQQILTLRIDNEETWESICKHTGIPERQLKAVGPLLNQYKSCKRCHRPVYLGTTPTKKFCNSACQVNYHKGSIHFIENEVDEIPGRKFSLTKTQINDAAERIYVFHDTLREVAEDLGCSTNTLSRTLKAVGGKSLRSPKDKECVLCLKPFKGKVGSKYCSPACCTKAYRLRMTQVCALCGKNFVAAGKNKYCSKKCTYIGIHKTRKAQRKVIEV